MAAITIDRTDPRVTGITKANLFANRMRWAAALLGSAAVLGVGLFLWGGYEVFVIVPAALAAIIVAVSGKRERGKRERGKRQPVSGKKQPASPRQLSRRSRIMLALPFTVLALLIVAAGVLHITVWNPLARVPGLHLDEIYSAMSAANETPLAEFVMVWAMFWGAAGMALPILSGIPRLASILTARRIVVTGLLIVGATASFHWLAGFNMGMSLADTFMTSGGDAAMSGAVIAMAGQTALVAALLIGLTPRRHAAEMAIARPH